MTPVLETERLVLREWREADVDALMAFWSDDTATRFMGGRRTRDDVWRLITLYLGH